MKCIATVDSKKYICEVSHDELEMFMNLYYNKMDRLKVGDEVDLGKGYKFDSNTREALRKTSEFIAANRTVLDAITEGISVMSILAEKSE